MTVGDTVFCRDDLAVEECGPRPNQKGRVLRVEKQTVTVEFDEPFWSQQGKPIRTWVFLLIPAPGYDPLDHISALCFDTPAIDHLLSFLEA